MGRADIAQFLLRNGARPDLFCAAMLGWQAVIRTALEEDPMLVLTPGPHGIPLIAHAQAGDQSELVDYLKAIEERVRGPV